MTLDLGPGLVRLAQVIEDEQIGVVARRGLLEAAARLAQQGGQPLLQSRQGGRVDLDLALERGRGVLMLGVVLAVTLALGPVQAPAASVTIDRIVAHTELSAEPFAATRQAYGEKLSLPDYYRPNFNAAELGQAIDDGRYEEELAGVYDECGRYGINGVPTFIIGRYMVVGAQPYDVLERALTLAEQEEAAAS